MKKNFRNSELSLQVRQTLHHSFISIMHFRISGYVQVQQTVEQRSTNSTPLLHLHKAFSKTLGMPHLPSGGLQIIHHSFISTNCRYLCSNDKAFSKFEIPFTGSTNSPHITIMHFWSYYLCFHHQMKYEHKTNTLGSWLLVLHMPQGCEHAHWQKPHTHINTPPW